MSRNPRGRGHVLATVDLDQIIGVGITKSIAGGDCHCLIYLIDGKKPLRIASGTEPEIRRIRDKMDDYVTPAADGWRRKWQKAPPDGRASLQSALITATRWNAIYAPSGQTNSGRRPS